MGPLEVWTGGERVRLSGAGQQRVLAALLLSAGHVVPLSRLVDAVWPQDPPPTAEKRVRNLVSELRRLLGDGGSDGPVAAGAGYRLDVGEDALDAAVFDRRVRRARRHAAEGEPAEAVTEFRAALNLWRGPVLAGLECPALQPQVTSWEERRTAALEEDIDLELDLGRHHSVISELTEQVAAHPLRERLAGQLMLALHRAGRRAEALRVFHDTRGTLAEELGLDPGEQLQRLHQRILASDPGLAAPPPDRRKRVHQLPHDLADFTGRTAELNRLVSALPDEGEEATAVVINSIDGMAGIGKTALAVHVAHRLAGRFPDVQLFIDLHTHTAGEQLGTTSAALDTLLRAVGVPGEQIPDKLHQRAGLWRAELADLKALIVLDNATSAEEVRPLLPGNPGSLVLITSRRRLTDLEAACTLSLEVLPPADAVALFTRIADDARAVTEPRSVQEVVRLCGHLPLAVRIAAARLRTRPTWTLAHLIERLADQQRRLGELATGDRSVAAAFSLSYRHLTPVQQRLFRLLSLHRGTDFDAYTAAAVADITVQEAESLLEDLLDIHLLQQHTVGRYRFHDLLHTYAAQLVLEEDTEADRRAALGRVLDHYLASLQGVYRLERNGCTLVDAMVATRSAGIAFSDLAEGQTWVSNELDGILGAIRMAAADPGAPIAVAADLLLALDPMGDVAFLWPRLNGPAAEVADAARARGESRAEARARYMLGGGLWQIDRLDEGEEQIRRGIRAAQDGGDEAIPERLLNVSALLASARQNYEEALEIFQEGLAACRRSGNWWSELEILNNIAALHIIVGGRPQEALAWVTRGLELVDRVGGQPYAWLYLMINRGRARVALGRPAEAVEDFHAALKASRARAFPFQEALALQELMQATRQLGQLEQALGHAEASLAIWRQLGQEAKQTEIREVQEEIHAELNGSHPLTT
ncbi:winged helix-turn-helix domain-containing protein [Actinomadura graeca]|uniref:Winged helix-turn-helix domain-containing protein n=1 Tax=Actinomadura graeca TaxID=2750812 RepID=A0ABX8QQQ0_9ACTN|nr:BTAD domain-containing putative transcriptional regulator [Actinomadura graeca]QXJ21115.1 winged helix-turn-helix domain-containing protein [Actinomadura graeca]